MRSRIAPGDAARIRVRPLPIIEHTYGDRDGASRLGVAWKRRDVVTVLSRRQRSWDEALTELGIDPADIDRGADTAVSLSAWRRIARHLEARGQVHEAAEAWDWAVSEALEADELVLGDGENALWEASAFFERHDAMGSLRATLEQAWASLRFGTPVSAEFVARLLRRLAAVYERLRMPERAAEANARAATIAGLVEPPAISRPEIQRCA
jgi:hypothetical protein